MLDELPTALDMASALTETFASARRDGQARIVQLLYARTIVTDLEFVLPLTPAIAVKDSEEKNADSKTAHLTAQDTDPVRRCLETAPVSRVGLELAATKQFAMTHAANTENASHLKNATVNALKA